MTKNNPKNLILAFLSLYLISMAGISLATAETVIIVNPANSIADLSEPDLRAIFLGKKKRFPDGKKADFVMQNAETDATSAMLTLLRKSEAQLERYWIQLVFSGKGSSPVTLKNDAAVKTYVSENIEGIGYIDASAVDDSVKIIHTIE